MPLILREKINLAIITLRISVDQKNNMQWEDKPQTWRRYSHLLSKGLISRICKEFLLTEKKKTYLFLNGQKYDRTFTEKESQTGYNM